MKTIPGIQERYCEQILKLFNQLPDGKEVILFGSRAKGKFREGSDIDIALKGKKLNLETRDKLIAQYESLHFPWKLDIVIYDLIEEPGLKEHIDRVGVKLDLRNQ